MRYGVFKEMTSISFAGKGLVSQFNALAMTCILTPTRVFAEVDHQSLETWVLAVSSLGLPTSIKKTSKRDVFGREIWEVEVNHKGCILVE